MSNLTQFFGIQSTGGTVASSVTGEAAEALTAGDGLRLNEHGQFIKGSKASLRKGAHTQQYNHDASAETGNGLNLGAESIYGRYTPYENGPGSGFIATDGTYIQLFYKDINQSSTAYFGFRCFDMSTYDQNSIWFKDFVSGGYNSNMYGSMSAQYKEIYKDANYIHIAVTVGWRDSSANYRNRGYVLRLTRATKVLTIFAGNTTEISQYSPYNNAHNNGSGTVGTLANGVLVRSYQVGDTANDRSGGMRINTFLYDYNAPAALTSAQQVSGTVANYNDAVSSMHLYDHDTRTFISFEAPVALNNSKVVKKHVIAANGAITTTTVDSAFVLSNWADAEFNKWSQVYQISAGIYAAVFAETATTISIQKFTWDGNTTLAQSGSKIVLTMPSDVEMQYAATFTFNYDKVARLADNDPKQLYIQSSTRTTATYAQYNIISINLVAGTLNFARRTFGLSSGSTEGGAIAIGGGKALVLQNSTYQSFAYQRYELAFFTSELRTKDVVAVALANATVGQTDATAALYSGVTSTATLPATHYVPKNGQSYLLDVANNELPSERLNKEASKLKWIGRRSDNSALSVFKANQNQGADWYNSASFNTIAMMNIRNQTAAGGTGTSILKVAGKGMFKSEMYFGHRYNSSSAITAQIGLYIDDVLVWDNGSHVSFNGWNYYNYIPHLDGIVFNTGFELKIIYANNASNLWNGAVKTVEMT